MGIIFKNLQGFERICKDLKWAVRTWNDLSGTEKFERILRIPDGVLERIWKNSKKSETIRKHRKVSRIIRKNKNIERIWRRESERKCKNLKESGGTWGIWENLREIGRFGKNLKKFEWIGIWKELGDLERNGRNLSKLVRIWANFEEFRRI